MATDVGERYRGLLRDLADEGAELERVAATLTPEQWRLPTQTAGWTVAHQIGHLEITERLMHAAVVDEDVFREMARTARTRPDLSPHDIARADVGEVRLQGWIASRDALLEAFAAQPPTARIPWMGPPMSVASAATSRIMEIWAHGQDVLDAVGLRRDGTARLRHIAHLAVAARDYSFANRGLAPPAEPFRVEVRGPGGELWTWGPEDAAQRVTAEAYDFALLATRRIHRSDADVSAEGRDAVRWLKTIQAYAGPPGPRRRPHDGGASASAKAPPENDGITRQG
jgi:uncharacterized protein (TIGR03084 family)